jgi:hypothetical protein
MYFENELVLYIRADTGCYGNKCTLVVEEFVGEFMGTAIGFTALLQFWEV